MADQIRNDRDSRTPRSCGRRKTTGGAEEKSFGIAFFLTFIILLGVWILLSGLFDAFHLSLGVISCLMVAYFSGDLLFSSPDLKRLAFLFPRFMKYVPWLLYQVFLANLQVLYLAFHPKMMAHIDPRIIEFRSGLRSDMALVTFANSITLTPGTITVSASIYGDFRVHAIAGPFADTLPGEMEARVAQAFGES